MLEQTLLCARIYAERLGDWENAVAVVLGYLDIHPLQTEPLGRIEAWRLLARCLGACGDVTGACAALESALAESTAARYVWLEARVREELRPWVELMQGDNG